MRGEERGGPWRPYPRARRLGVDGIGVGRGWSDRLGRYSAEEDDPVKILQTVDILIKFPCVKEIN